MLKALTIKNFVIVENLDLEFSKAGFFALTGETGAGKSILVGALSLLLGERVDSKVVRDGCDKADISAEFSIDGLFRVQQLLKDDGLFELGHCVLRRTFDRGGRSRAWINGAAATLSQLKSIGMHLVNIHGQHDHQLLTRSAEQRTFLDGFAGAGILAKEVSEKWHVWQTTKQTRIRAEQDAAANAKELDYLKWQLKEMDIIDFSSAEWPAIETEYKKLSNFALLSENMRQIIQIVSENDNSIVDQMLSVRKILDSSIEHDRNLQELGEVIDTANIQLNEFLSGSKSYFEKLEYDPNHWNSLERKIDNIYALSVKHKEPVEKLPDLKKQLSEKINGLEGSVDSNELLSNEVEARDIYQELASKLTVKRREGAEDLENKITVALGLLGMKDKIFKVVLSAISEDTAFGQEKIEFCMSNKAVLQPQPIARVASGGELSRISLAIQTVMTNVIQVPTMIFDEVDSGIGGGVAETVGRLMRDLGSKHQVMCVTHLAQVAASAQQQWRIKKNTDGQSVRSSAELLDKEGRVKELARMIGGLDVTDISIQHAAEMLETASRFD